MHQGDPADLLDAVADLRGHCRPNPRFECARQPPSFKIHLFLLVLSIDSMAPHMVAAPTTGSNTIITLSL
jgi:hypothetical protein